MGIVVGSVMGQGFLTRRADNEVRRKPSWLAESRRQQFLAYYQLLDDAAMSPVELCLRFAISDKRILNDPNRLQNNWNSLKPA